MQYNAEHSESRLGSVKWLRRKVASSPHTWCSAALALAALSAAAACRGLAAAAVSPERDLGANGLTSGLRPEGLGALAVPLPPSWREGGGGLMLGRLLLLMRLNIISLDMIWVIKLDLGDIWGVKS